MEFDQSFFQEEGREGFLISSKMKHAWAAQLEILEDIENVCKKHGLTYWASFGTLLGAVRHKGFIPWDDDVDIMMKRSDYDYFWQVAAKDLPDIYIVYNMHTTKLREICYFSRIISGQETRFDDWYLGKYHGFPYVTGIDIYPIDAYPPDGDERRVQRQLLTAAQQLLRLTYNRSVIDPGLEDSLQTLEEYCSVQLPRNEETAWELMKLQERLVTAYREDEENVTELGIVNTGWPPISKQAFSDTIRLDFEHITMPVPVGYEEVVISMYGKDYMTPKQSVSRAYPFYKGQEQHFFDVHGFIPEF